MTEWRTIPATHPALPGHFPGNPIVPGVVVLSHVWDAICRQTSEAVRCTSLPNVKFLSPLRPGEPFTVVVEITRAGSAKFICKTADRNIAQGSMCFAAITETAALARTGWASGSAAAPS